MYEKTSSAVRSSAGYTQNGWDGIGSSTTKTGVRRSTYGNLTSHKGEFDMPSYPRTTGKVIDDDSNSTENILPANDTTIVMTTEVDVKYNQK